MGWESRGNHSYYYQKTRDGGRVRSRYVSGYVAQLAARADAQSRIRRLEARRMIRDDRDDDKRFIDACRRLNRAARGVLLAAGFHQHKRQWRRRMAGVKEKAHEVNTLARAEAAELELMVQAYTSDDPSPAAKEMVARHLSFAGAWRDDADLMGKALADSVKKLSASNYFRGESLKRGLEEMREELGYETSTLPERLLIEQVLLCWLRLSVVEDCQTRTMTGSHPYVYLNYLETATTHAQRRYTNAIQSLARVRRLLRPRGALFQINVLSVNGANPKREAITVGAHEVKR
jgi:hypothetical protein